MLDATATLSLLSINLLFYWTANKRTLCHYSNRLIIEGVRTLGLVLCFYFCYLGGLLGTVVERSGLRRLVLLVVFYYNRGRLLYCDSIILLRL